LVIRNNYIGFKFVSFTSSYSYGKGFIVFRLKASMIALTLHEAEPGHHTQVCQNAYLYQVALTFVEKKQPDHRNNETSKTYQWFRYGNLQAAFKFHQQN
jgi:hypothetical protein